MPTRMLLLFTVLGLAACDEKQLIIESDTSWEGTVTYAGAIAGTGNATVDLTDVPSDVCWSIKKTTSAGTLRAYLLDETWFGLGSENDDDQVTTAPGGVVEGCNR